MPDSGIGTAIGVSSWGLPMMERGESTPEKKEDPQYILRKLLERKEAEERQIKEGEIVILERDQVNTNNPAIARLWIRFSPRLQCPNDLPGYFDELERMYPLDADVHKITRMDRQTYMVEIRSHKMMYSWMEYFIDRFQEDYGPTGKGYTIQVKGFWHKFCDS